MHTTNSFYGRGENLERYPVTQNNITKNEDLKPVERRPRK
jgi:hypothetical protein